MLRGVMGSRCSWLLLKGDEEEEEEQVPVSFDFVADIKGKDIDIDVLIAER